MGAQKRELSSEFESELNFKSIGAYFSHCRSRSSNFDLCLFGFLMVCSGRTGRLLERLLICSGRIGELEILIPVSQFPLSVIAIFVFVSLIHSEELGNRVEAV